MTLEEWVRRRREEREAEVAEAEATALAAGKERFDLARLEQLLGAEPGSRSEQESSLRHNYYLVHTKLRTLGEYAELLQHWSMWE